MARISRDDIESRWYDCFSGWTHADRESAMKVLATLHRHLPADPKAKPPKTDKTPANGQPSETVRLFVDKEEKLAIGDKHQ